MKSVFLDASAKLLVVLLLAVSPITTFAQSFYWGDVPGYPTPLAYCDANKGIHTNVYVTFQSPTLALCWGRHSSGAVLNFAHVARSGDSCPPESQYDEATGSCKLPSPDAGKVCDGKDADGFPNIINTSGECVPYFRADVPAQCKRLSNKTEATKYWIMFDTDGNPQQPPSAEKRGCKVKLTIGANCKPPAAREGVNGVSMAPAQASNCVVAATYTGEVAPDASASQAAANPATGQEGECADGQDCNVPEPPKVEEKKDCNYVLDGDGRKVCSSFQYKGDPGNMDCGSVNGKFECITRPASSTGNKVDTKVETQANPDGSTTSTKTDTATKVTCPSGSSSCKTTTTTTTTTTHKNPDGTTSGSSTQTTCKGDECTPTATGGGGGGNKGKGDDTTNCDPATDPKACEGTSTDGGGKKCDAPIKCDGDAVMCAILQQQHKDTCELMKDPTDEQKSKLQQDKAVEQAKVDALQTELDQKASSLFADFQVKASGSQYGGKCLEDKQVDIMGASFTFPFSQACPYLYLLRYALIAMAYLAAARIVSRGI